MHYRVCLKGILKRHLESGQLIDEAVFKVHDLIDLKNFSFPFGLF